MSIVVKFLVVLSFSVKTNALRRCGVINSLVLLYFFFGFFSINYLNASYQFKIDIESVVCSFSIKTKPTTTKKFLS